MKWLHAISCAKCVCVCVCVCVLCVLVCVPAVVECMPYQHQLETFHCTHTTNLVRDALYTVQYRVT